MYLIARGHKMSEHADEAAQAPGRRRRAYIQHAAGTSSSAADELSRLADLKAQGVIDDAEFEKPQGERPRDHSAGRDCPSRDGPLVTSRIGSGARQWRRKRLAVLSHLGQDIPAGAVLGVESVPDGLATGLLAGVNPLAGLNGYMVGTVAGAFATFGETRKAWRTSNRSWSSCHSMSHFQTSSELLASPTSSALRTCTAQPNE